MPKYLIRKEMELCVDIEVTADNEEEARDASNDVWDAFVPYNHKGSRVSFIDEQEIGFKVSHV